jgi:hypothetical protein
MPSVKIYRTPAEFHIDMHFVRPRFKNELEDVLSYFSNSISKITPAKAKEFNVNFDNFIQGYPGNDSLKPKTIANWRTEISALLGFIQYDDGTLKSSRLANELSNEQDFISFFKCFTTKLQFPGGHIKDKFNCELIERDIKFKPAALFLKVIKLLNKVGTEHSYLTKDEATYILLNDSRFLSVDSDLNIAVKIIQKNRNEQYLEYDGQFGCTKSHGDQTRTAGDILDYMELANILQRKGRKFFINTSELKVIDHFLKKPDLFQGYDSFYSCDELNASALSGVRADWFDYVNDLNFEDFKTDVGVFIRSHTITPDVDIEVDYETVHKLSTKEIGDKGEAIIIAHEKAKLTEEGADHLTHLVKFMPTHLAVGYDVQSREFDDSHKYIEVKTTVSNKKLTQYRFHLTPNEWNSAFTNRGTYYVYRLVITAEKRSLFIIKDPVGAFQQGLVKVMSPSGFDIIYNEKSGWDEKLLA